MTRGLELKVLTPLCLLISYPKGQIDRITMGMPPFHAKTERYHYSLCMAWGMAFHWHQFFFFWAIVKKAYQQKDHVETMIVLDHGKLMALRKSEWVLVIPQFNCSANCSTVKLGLFLLGTNVPHTFISGEIRYRIKSM